MFQRRYCNSVIPFNFIKNHKIARIFSVNSKVNGCAVYLGRSIDDIVEKIDIESGSALKEIGKNAFSKLKYESGDCDHLISDIFSEPVILQTSDGVVTPYQTTHSFFFYPNPTVGDSSSSTWSHRWTRLVVEATLDGTTYYYPVSFRNTYPNYLYKITDMKITGPGSTSPELPIIKRDFTVNLYIQDWTGETVQEVEY